MASNKSYAYYLRGSQIALIEESLTVDSKWKSPTETIADGLEIEYAYSPRYFINETEDKNTAIDTYVSLGGLLKIIDQGDDNYSASPESLSDGSYIVLKKAGRFNGLHKVKEAGVGYITLYTKFSGSATVQKVFEESPELYYNVDVLNDESDTIDLPEYLSKALVYYVKSRIAEDKMDIEAKEYFLREFRAIVEKHESSKVWSARKVIPGAHSIR
tara:strand:+ start:595 stop:1239 length:645 start_codon:yes stop_codon:yes gene_type:complete